MFAPLANRGPQITARPGTKRHVPQMQARAVFLGIVASDARHQASKLAKVVEINEKRGEAS